MRRLPVYIVVDTSESMFGEPIDQINRSLDLMLASLHRNPYALETAWLSLITFDSIARALVPLTDISEFKIPELKARPGTALGTALELLRVQIAKEVEPATETEKGDWRPIVFLLTDGQPTDSWRPALARSVLSRRTSTPLLAGAPSISTCSRRSRTLRSARPRRRPTCSQNCLSG